MLVMHPTKGEPLNRLFNHSFVQEIFTEHLLCADTVLGMKGPAVTPAVFPGHTLVQEVHNSQAQTWPAS